MPEPTKRMILAVALVGVLAALSMTPASAAGPSFVDITWFSISNMYYELGPAQDRHRRLHHADSAVRVLRRRRRSREHAPAVQAGRGRRHARDERARRPIEREPAADRPQPFRSLVRHRHLVHAHRRAHHRIEDDLPPGACAEGSRRSVPRGVWTRSDSAGGRHHDESGAVESQRRSCAESGAAQPCGAHGGAGAGPGDRRPARRRGGGLSERRRQSRLSVHRGWPAGTLQLVLPEFRQRGGSADAHRGGRRRLRRAARESEAGDERRGPGRPWICGSARAAGPSPSSCCRC